MPMTGKITVPKIIVIFSPAETLVFSFPRELSVFFSVGFITSDIK
jgi:hypothetical protein